MKLGFSKLWAFVVLKRISFKLILNPKLNIKTGISITEIKIGHHTVLQNYGRKWSHYTRMNDFFPYKLY